MAALVSFPKLPDDHDDDMTEPVRQSFPGDMNVWATDLPLGHSDTLVGMVFALIQVLQEEQLENLAIFLATAFHRAPPPFDLFQGLCHEYIRSKIHGRTTVRSHGEVMEIVRHQLIIIGLCPSFGSLSTITDETSEVLRYLCGSRHLKVGSHSQA